MLEHVLIGKVRTLCRNMLWVCDLHVGSATLMTATATKATIHANTMSLSRSVEPEWSCSLYSCVDILLSCYRAHGGERSRLEGGWGMLGF